MLRSKKVARQRFLCVPIEQFFFFRVTFCPTILHPITSFLFLTLVLLACMMLSFLFLALFVFRADLCVFFFCSVSIRVCIYVLCGFVTSKRVFLRVFSLGCCCCCCCCCVFLATIHCFTFHYGFFFIVFYALSLSCTDMILLGVNCTTGGIRGVGRASQQHVGGDPPRI